LKTSTLEFLAEINELPAYYRNAMSFKCKTLSLTMANNLAFLDLGQRNNNWNLKL